MQLKVYLLVAFLLKVACFNIKKDSSSLVKLFADENSMRMNESVEFLKKDPSSFVESFAEADPDAINQVIGMLETLIGEAASSLKTLEDRKTETLNNFNTANSELVVANQNQVNANRNKKEAQEALQVATSAETNADDAKVDAEDKQQNAQIDKENAEKNYNDESQGLRDERTVLEEVIQKLLPLIACIDAADKPETSPAVTGFYWSHNGYWGGYIAQGSTNTVAGCAQKCDEYSGCVGFSRHRAGSCYVYTSMADIYGPHNPNHGGADTNDDAYARCSGGKMNKVKLVVQLTYSNLLTAAEITKEENKIKNLVAAESGRNVNQITVRMEKVTRRRHLLEVKYDVTIEYNGLDKEVAKTLVDSGTGALVNRLNNNLNLALPVVVLDEPQLIAGTSSTSSSTSSPTSALEKGSSSIIKRDGFRFRCEEWQEDFCVRPYWSPAPSSLYGMAYGGCNIDDTSKLRPVTSGSPTSGSSKCQCPVSSGSPKSQCKLLCWIATGDATCVESDSEGSLESAKGWTYSSDQDDTNCDAKRHMKVSVDSENIVSYWSFENILSEREAKFLRHRCNWKKVNTCQKSFDENTTIDLLMGTQSSDRHQFFGSSEQIKFPVGENDRLTYGYDMQKGQTGSPFKSILNCVDNQVDGEKNACIEEIQPTLGDYSYSILVKDKQSRDDFISAAASAEGGALGVKVSMSAKYSEQSKITESSVSFILGSSLFITNQRIRNPSDLKLTESAKEMLQSNPDQFLNSYGLYYVSSITFGGTFLGSFNLMAKDVSSTNDVQAAAEISYTGGIWSAKGSAEFEKKTSEESSHIEKYSSYNFIGGTDVGGVIESPQNMSNKFLAWKKALNKDKSAPTYLHVQRWYTSQDIQDIVNSPDFSQKFGNDIRDHFVKAPVLLERTTEEASKERLNSQLLVKSLNNIENWPMFTRNKTFAQELTDLKNDAQNYYDECILKMDDKQLFALQDELRGGTPNVNNTFGTWLYYQNYLQKRYNDLMKANVCELKLYSTKRLVVNSSPYRMYGHIATMGCQQQFEVIGGGSAGVICDDSLIMGVYAFLETPQLGTITCTPKIYPKGCTESYEGVPGYCNTNGGHIGYYVVMDPNGPECLVEERFPISTACTDNNVCMTNYCMNFELLHRRYCFFKNPPYDRSVGVICSGSGPSGASDAQKQCASRTCKYYPSTGIYGFCW